MADRIIEKKSLLKRAKQRKSRKKKNVKDQNLKFCISGMFRRNLRQESWSYQQRERFEPF